MTAAPADLYRDPEVVARLRQIAAGIFAHRGIDFNGVRRAGGWTNATWVGGGLALRLSTTVGNENILREARLTALLPAEAGCPQVMESGQTDGYAWILSREAPGMNLGEVWPGLDWDRRILALRQLWVRTRAVHSVNPAAAAGLARTQPWFNAAGMDEAGAALRRLAAQGLFDRDLTGILAGRLECFWQSLPGAARVLNHGDLTIENALWHEGQISALLDFEHAVLAPLELDLNELVKMAFAPGEPNQGLSGPGSAGMRQLRDAVAEIALPLLDHPGGKDLLIGYAILLELWLLEDWLAHPEGEGPLETWLPYRMLLSLKDGQGGYLAPLLARLG
jgi:aminoglycoside phosphotransferase (APT) family kinase protein